MQVLTGYEGFLHVGEGGADGSGKDEWPRGK